METFACEKELYETKYTVHIGSELEGADVTDQMQTLREDVAFMRGLAEEGRNSPLQGGDILVAAGVFFGAASLVQYAAFTDRVSAAVSNWSWLVSAALFAVALAASIRRSRRMGGPRGANRATDAAWMGLGFAISAIFGAFVLASVRTDQWGIMAMLSPVILALYGAAWCVAGELTGKTWIKAVAGASFILAVAVAWLTGTAEQSLAYAAALVLVALLPGLVLMRQARAARA